MRAVFISMGRIMLAMLIMGLAASPCRGQETPGLIKNPELAAQLKAFAAKKEDQAQSLATAAGNPLPAELGAFFAAAENGNWQNLTNYYAKIHALHDWDPRYHRSWWQPVVETFGALDQFSFGNETYATAYGGDIIQSIPPGSIYFGGTDPGRFIITFLQKSQSDGDPFYTLTQNAFADETYLDYLRTIYGGKIYIPTTNELQKCFDIYYTDVQERMRKGELQPGEKVSTDPATGKLQVSGQVSVMDINALLARIIFDKNPGREFYVEESFPLQWMYPYLEPHGLIFKLNRHPLEALSTDTVQQDHEFWTKTILPMIGAWLAPTTSVQDISVFAEKVYRRHDFTGFTGDTNFVLDARAYSTFAKERASDGGLYAWHTQHDIYMSDKQRMNDEADFAYRQAWALCPDSPEAVFRYVQFLTQSNRLDDAIVVARTSLSLDPYNSSIGTLIRNLEQLQKNFTRRPQTAAQAQALEAQVQSNPTNYANVFALAGYYLQMQETNRVTKLLQQVIAQPQAPADALHTAVQFFAQTRDWPDLETTLKKLCATSPQVPETWYDLARIEAHLGKNDDAVKSLRVAIDYSDERLQKFPRAVDIRALARAQGEFKSIRNRPDFQNLVSP